VFYSHTLNEIEVGWADLLLIDPPWKFKTFTPAGLEKSPEKHYRTMPMEEIAALPVKTWSRRNCLLLCWGTQALLNKQMDCVRQWGFEFKSVVVWQKMMRSGKESNGTGFRVRSMCEFIIIAARGEPKQSAAFPGIFRGTRRRHSEKPEEFYQLIDRCCGFQEHRIDVFARQPRPGWRCYGDEVTKFAVAA
jgi:N6-adenosine-specific RNA methylase IME4